MVVCILHGCKTFLFLFPSFSFLLHVGGLPLPPPSFFSQPACRCLPTTWRLTVICSRFPKPTTWARRRPTGSRSRAPAGTTAAAATPGGAGTPSNTPTTTTTNRPRRTCGRRTNTARAGDIPRRETTAIMAAPVDTLRRATQKSPGRPGHPRGTLRTRRCATTPRDARRPREGVGNRGLAGITPRITATLLGTTMASAPPGRETPTGPPAASLSHLGTCRASLQVHALVLSFFLLFCRSIVHSFIYIAIHLFVH